MTVLVDGDFICYWHAHALQSQGGKLEDSTHSQFAASLLNQLHHLNKKWLQSNATRYIFCFDEGKSWRYEYLEQFGIKYKDRSEAKSKRPLDGFHEYRAFFRKVLVQHKFTVIGMHGYEADDCIHILANMIEEREIGILTGDSDSQQELISTGEKEIFILSPHDKQTPLVRTVRQPEKKKIDDDFFAEDVPATYIETAQNVKYVDPAHKLFVKVICGDSTDTIPSAFKFAGGTIGETRAENIFREIQVGNAEENYQPVADIEQIRRLFISREERIKFIKWVISITKLKFLDQVDLFDVGLLRNIKCILLDNLVYDPVGLSLMKDAIKAILEKPSTVGTNLPLIFKDTEFDPYKAQTNYYKY